MKEFQEAWSDLKAAIYCEMIEPYIIPIVNRLNDFIEGNFYE